MKISVIIPALNEEKNIARTLDNIFSSNYPDFEVIVSDNGSVDKTSEIAASKGAKVVVEKRKGTMWACEAGRKIANGEIIVRLDADCLPKSDWLSRGAKHFANKKVVLVSGPYDYFDGPKGFRYFTLGLEKYIYAPVNAILSAMHVGGITLGGNTFIRTAALSAIGGFNTSITFYGDDTDLPKRLSSKGKIIFDGSLVLKTSARRFKNEGTIKIGATYIFHFFRVLFSSRN